MQGIPVSQQSIVFKNRILEDGECLGQCEVYDGCALTLVLKVQSALSNLFSLGEMFTVEDLSEAVDLQNVDVFDVTGMDETEREDLLTILLNTTSQALVVYKDGDVLSFFQLQSQPPAEVERESPPLPIRASSSPSYRDRVVSASRLRRWHESVTLRMKMAEVRGRMRAKKTARQAKKAAAAAAAGTAATATTTTATTAATAAATAATSTNAQAGPAPSAGRVATDAVRKSVSHEPLLPPITPRPPPTAFPAAPTVRRHSLLAPAVPPPRPVAPECTSTAPLCPRPPAAARSGSPAYSRPTSGRASLPRTIATPLNSATLSRVPSASRCSPSQMTQTLPERRSATRGTPRGTDALPHLDRWRASDDIARSDVDRNTQQPSPRGSLVVPPLLPSLAPPARPSLGATGRWPSQPGACSSSCGSSGMLPAIPGAYPSISPRLPSPRQPSPQPRPRSQQRPRCATCQRRLKAAASYVCRYVN